MHTIGTDECDHPTALLAAEDEDVARRSAARLLITAATQQRVEMLARRIHAAGPRGQFPLIHRCAGDLVTCG